ncbi:unnamed protein product [Ceratitis capitata]|uniref:(Mediterranean fruit fly) hypothetical protein n=1 Tax=Ceratitis capitata TaxID=7213 RepID=A0A811V3K1_CERCA|nr:unnamed protein product [Ceratitis capitata]
MRIIVCFLSSFYSLTQGKASQRFVFLHSCCTYVYTMKALMCPCGVVSNNCGNGRQQFQCATSIPLAADDYAAKPQPERGSDVMAALNQQTHMLEEQQN